MNLSVQNIVAEYPTPEGVTFTVRDLLAIATADIYEVTGWHPSSGRHKSRQVVIPWQGLEISPLDEVDVRQKLYVACTDIAQELLGS